MDRAKVINVFENEPLVEHKLSLPMLSDSLYVNNKGSLYYGTGLCNSHCLSIGVPFDVLSMVLVAEKFRQTFELSGVIHHIADTHAICNLPEKKKEVFAKAAEFEVVMEKVIAKLGLHHFTIVRASSFDDSPEYNIFMCQVGNSGNGEYAQRELADMLWYQKNHNVVLKLGWADKSFERDERSYDDVFVRCFGKTLSFAYTKPGHTFTRKVVPYIATTEEDRIFLRAGEQVQLKFDRLVSKARKDTVQGAVNYFAAICRLYENLIHRLDKGALPQKIQQIINYIFD